MTVRYDWWGSRGGVGGRVEPAVLREGDLHLLPGQSAVVGCLRDVPPRSKELLHGLAGLRFHGVLRLV